MWDLICLSVRGYGISGGAADASICVITRRLLGDDKTIYKICIVIVMCCALDPCGYFVPLGGSAYMDVIS